MANSKRFRWFGVALLTAALSSGAGIGNDVNKGGEILSRTSHAFNDIAQAAMPAVVSISVIKSAEVSRARLPMPFGHPDGEEGGTRSLGIGSGVLIRADGYILTNHHVIEGAEKVTVTFDDKFKLEARVVGTDSKTDLAVIRLNSDRKNFPRLEFGDSAGIKVGDWAIAIGSPFGLNRSVSSGIISAKGRAQMGILDVEDFIQTDAAINPGSSGGPLLNIAGQMIGINTAIFSQGNGFVGIGFAIPAVIAKDISEQLIAKGRVERGYIGLAAQDLDAELARHFKVSSEKGALISDVAPEGPAAKASLKPGDVVLAFNHRAIDSASHLKQLTGKTKAGTRIPLEISREGRKKTLDVRIQEPPADPKAVALQQAGRAGGTASLGLVVEDIPEELADFLAMDADRGVLVASVEPGSPAFEAGISPGDVILSADRDDVKSAKEFKKHAEQMLRKKSGLIYLQRGPDERVFVPIKVS